MYIDELLKEKNMSKYQLSKNSGVPYTTLNDICNGKTSVDKCNVMTVYKLADSLGVTMEEMIEPYINTRSSFELFKSSVCHRLKELGDMEFLIKTISEDEISTYYNKKWYPECLYLLAMVDYISRINNIMLCSDYDDLRDLKLADIIYPAGVLMLCAAKGNDEPKKQAISESIPEFMRFNIVESEVRNVV